MEIQVTDLRCTRTDRETDRKVIEFYRQKLSPRRVGQELGISVSCVRSILIRNNEPRRTLSEACMKYPKKNFSDDPTEKARMIGFMEDCSAAPHYRQTRVETTTSHPAQLKLFDELFGGYGHVGRLPGYNKQCSVYEWHTYVLLDRSFYFLLEYKKKPMRLLAEIVTSGYEMIRIGSFGDAESWIGIKLNNGSPQAVLSITNNSRQLLAWTKRTIGGRINLDKRVYQLVLRGYKAVQVLRRLPLNHEEKVASSELILHYADNGGIGAEALIAYQKLRRKIDEEVWLCTMQARLEWIRRHGKAHPKDPDQSMPNA